MDDHPDTSGSDGADETKAATNGQPGSTASIADQAADSIELPQPKPLGEGQQTFPGLGGGRRKVPIKHKVKLRGHEVEGAGAIKPEEDLLLIVRAQKTGDTDKYKRDGDDKIIEVAKVHAVLPTWIESVDDWLDSIGAKLVDADGPGEALDPSNLFNIEEMRREREDALA